MYTFVPLHYLSEEIIVSRHLLLVIALVALVGLSIYSDTDKKLLSSDEVIAIEQHALFAQKTQAAKAISEKYTPALQHNLNYTRNTIAAAEEEFNTFLAASGCSIPLEASYNDLYVHTNYKDEPEKCLLLAKQLLHYRWHQFVLESALDTINLNRARN